MKSPILSITLCSSVLVPPALAGESSTVINTGDFMKGEKPMELFLNGRLRSESVDHNAHLDSSTAVTLRHRVGLKTRDFYGFKFLVEGEHTYVLNHTSDYRAFPGAVGRAIIAAPDNFDLNRLQLSYSRSDTTLTVGRQSIDHGDQRFIGGVKWRQNDQTFDAISLQDDSIANLSLAYTYVNQVNRIFGTQAPSGALERWHGHAHLFRADYACASLGELSGFTYLLDFENATGASSNTYGLEWVGRIDLRSQQINYLFTGALQTEAGANTDYQEYYFRAQADTKFGGLSTGIGMERMTGDGNKAFIFPLGTNHKFNGFADEFLTTPSSGLRDYFVWLSGSCPLGVKHTLVVHRFSSGEENHYLGYELDYVAKKSLTQNTSLLLLLTHLEGHGAVKSSQRASIELNYNF